MDSIHTNTNARATEIEEHEVTGTAPHTQATIQDKAWIQRLNPFLQGLICKPPQITDPLEASLRILLFCVTLPGE